MELLVIAMILGIIPAMIANSKGRSMLGWWIYGTLIFIIALPHSILATNLHTQNQEQMRRQGQKYNDGPIRVSDPNFEPTEVKVQYASASTKQHNSNNLHQSAEEKLQKIEQIILWLDEGKINNQQHAELTRRKLSNR